MKTCMKALINKVSVKIPGFWGPLPRLHIQPHPLTWAACLNDPCWRRSTNKPNKEQTDPKRTADAADSSGPDTGIHGRYLSPELHRRCFKRRGFGRGASWRVSTEQQQHQQQRRRLPPRSAQFFLRTEAAAEMTRALLHAGNAPLPQSCGSYGGWLVPCGGEASHRSFSKQTDSSGSEAQYILNSVTCEHKAKRALIQFFQVCYLF